MQNITIFGRLGKEPELSYTPTSLAVVKFSVAVSKAKMVDGQRQEKTTWFSCVSFGKQAETINQYVKKGSQICLDLEYQVDEYTDRNGQKQWRHYFNVKSFGLVSSVEQNQQQPQPQQQYKQAQGPVQTTRTPPQRQGQQGQMFNQHNQPVKPEDFQGPTFTADDIPF